MLVDVALDDLDRQPDQVDGLLEVDHAGQRARARRRRPTAASGAAGRRRSSPASRYQSTKPRMPAWTISPTQDRSSALSSRNHGMSVSIRAIAAVLSAPVDALERVGGPVARDGRGSVGTRVEASAPVAGIVGQITQ